MPLVTKSFVTKSLVTKSPVTKSLVTTSLGASREAMEQGCRREGSKRKQHQIGYRGARDYGGERERVEQQAKQEHPGRHLRRGEPSDHRALVKMGAVRAE